MSLHKIFITDNFQSLVDDTECSLDCDCQDIIQKGYRREIVETVCREYHAPCKLKIALCQL